MFSYTLHYVKKYKWWYILGSLMVVFKNIASSLTPLYVQKAIDLLKDSFDSSVLNEYVLIIIIISLTKGLFLFGMRRITIGASRLIENDIRNDFFSKIQSLDMNFFHHHRTGDLMARATNDLTNIRSVFGPAIMYTVNLLFSFIAYLYMMIQISPVLTFWSVLPIPVMAVVVYFFSQIIHKKQTVIQNLYGKISTYAQENLAGARVVKSFAIEDQQSEEFAELNNSYYKRMINFLTINSLFHPMIYVIISFGLASILYVGGQQVIRNEISIGELTAFILYLSLLTWPAIAVGWVAGLYQTGAASLKRIQEILNVESTVLENEQLKPEFEGNIEFKDLNFKYPNTDNTILKNINITINKGETLGIVGPVGCGKTSLISLINRLYQVEDGMLFIDQLDINKIDVKHINNSISIVPQETFLFSETIHENITYGYQANEEELQNSIDKAQLKETLDEFEKGVDTILGERGINLSGGQKQRVAIARALIKPTSILILDDCLSAVDAQTEEKIIESFLHEQKQRTVIIVSHRISTLKHADQIIFMDQGEIVERGTHKELLELKGRYNQLHEKQEIEEELEEIN